MKQIHQPIQIEEELRDYCDRRAEFDWEMGIDEAGRGPVFGSMVYGACIWPIDQKEKLAKIGFDDSKKLTPIQRDNLFDCIERMSGKELAYKIENLTARFLSSNQLSLNEINLNQISHNAAFKMIGEFIAEGYNLKVVYLDTVGPTESYQNKLYAMFRDKNPGIKFVVREKADSIFPVVSAASICAKVIRDRVLTNWVFEENREFCTTFGSGYPADPITKKWLVDNFVPIFGYPTLVRFSWKTTETAMAQNKLQVKFHSESDYEYIPGQDKVRSQKENVEKKLKHFYKFSYSNVEF